MGQSDDGEWRESLRASDRWKQNSKEKGLGGNREVAGGKGQEDRHTVSQCLCVLCCQECASASKEGISGDNLIILTVSEGHKGIMEVKYCIPLVV